MALPASMQKRLDHLTNLKKNLELWGPNGDVLSRIIFCKVKLSHLSFNEPIWNADDEMNFDVKEIQRLFEDENNKNGQEIFCNIYLHSLGFKVEEKDTTTIDKNKNHKNHKIFDNIFGQGYADAYNLDFNLRTKRINLSCDLDHLRNHTVDKTLISKKLIEDLIDKLMNDPDIMESIMKKATLLSVTNTSYPNGSITCTYNSEIEIVI